jgi:hypothetical protein
MKTMRTWARVAAPLLCLALVTAACGDDDDEEDATSTTAPVATATSGGTAPTSTPAGDPAITIELPPAVQVPFDVTGEANVFEAALTVDVQNSAGDTLCVRHTMATSGSGTPGTYSATMAFPPPDADTAITVRAYSFSAMDGSIENLVERNVTLSPNHPNIFITSPACGTVASPGATLEVAGRAAVFEAALTVELRDASGAVVVGQNVMAASGVEESDYTASLAIPGDTPLGFYDLVAYTHSPEDGRVIDEFPVQIVIEP